MHVAIIGVGKTGREVLHLLSASEIHSRFDSKTQLTAEALKGADIAIVFVPGNTVLAISEVLLAAQIPVIWGSTGFQWPQDIDNRLREAKLTWVHGTNFSLGMVVMRRVIHHLRDLVKVLPEPSCHIVETHHKDKIDRPSGTALSWKSWFGQALEITSLREGDVVGQHRLEVETNNEVMSFEHRAKSRRIFAEGAIWAARLVATGSFCHPGLHLFEAMTEQFVEEIHRNRLENTFDS